MVYNVLEYLEEACRRSPDKTVIGDTKRELSYQEFLRFSSSIGTFLAQRGYAMPFVWPPLWESYMQAAAICLLTGSCPESGSRRFFP